MKKWTKNKKDKNAKNRTRAQKWKKTRDKDKTVKKIKQEIFFIENIKYC